MENSQSVKEMFKRIAERNLQVVRDRTGINFTEETWSALCKSDSEIAYGLTHGWNSEIEQLFEEKGDLLREGIQDRIEEGLEMLKDLN